MTDKTDPREKILAAAAKRILHYGYGKTTMSEIAADCDMSAGNIYRFFPAKIDIAEEMTRRFNASSHLAYQEIVSDKARPPSQRLLAFFAIRLERTFRVFEEYPKLMELAQIMGRERPEFLQEESARQRVFIEQILASGLESGEFSLSQSLTIAADLCQCATLKFAAPMLWTTERLDALQHELEGVLKLILWGLSTRN